MTVYSTNDEGWTPGGDVSAAFTTMLGTTLQTGDILLVDDFYTISIPTTINTADGITLIATKPYAGFDRIDTATHIDYALSFGSNCTLIGLRFTHSEAPVTGTTSTLPTIDVDYHNSVLMSASGSNFTVKECSFEGAVRVHIDLSNISDSLIENTRFILGLAQVRYLGTIHDPVCRKVLFDRAMGDGIKSVMGTLGVEQGYTLRPVNEDCVFLNPNRDGIDSTGGWYNGSILRSYFISGFTGLDLKSGFNSAADFDAGVPINSGIVCDTCEFINNGNAIVMTTLNGGGVLNTGNARTWACQDVLMKDSIVEVTVPANLAMYLVKDSHDARWENVQLLGSAYDYHTTTSLGLGIPAAGDITGTGLTTGTARTYAGDDYYRSLAGPDWTRIGLEYDGDLTAQFNEPATLAAWINETWNDATDTFDAEFENATRIDWALYNDADGQPTVSGGVWTGTVAQTGTASIASSPVQIVPNYSAGVSADRVIFVVSGAVNQDTVVFTFTENVAGATVVARWNAGSSDVTAIDGGDNWSSSLVAPPADVTSLSGVYNGVGSFDSFDASVDQGRVPQGVFDQIRFGGGSISFTGLTDGADYTVVLYFHENFYITAGIRAMDVTVAGTLVLDDWEPLDEPGIIRNVALAKEYAVTLSGTTTLTIDFTTVTDNAIISGIEILEA